LTEPILNCEPKQSDQCTALTNVRIAVLLVSSDFLYSEFIHDNELGPLLKRAEEGGIALVVDQSHMPGYSGSPGYLSIVH